MKIAKLSKVIKQNTAVIPTTTINGTMWIGDAFSLYPVYGMPILTEAAQVATLLDFPVDKLTFVIYQKLETDMIITIIII